MDDRFVVIDPGTGDALTLDRMDARIAEIAARLRRRGLRPGDEVVVCVSTSVDLLVVMEGVIAAGGVVVLLPPNGHLAEYLVSTTARMMVTDADEAREAAAQTHIRQVFRPTDLRGSGCTSG